MFPARYFPERFFSERFWPKIGAVDTTVDPNSWLFLGPFDVGTPSSRLALASSTASSLVSDLEPVDEVASSSLSSSLKRE